MTKEPLTFHLATLALKLNTLVEKLIRSAGIEIGVDQLAIITLLHFYGPTSQSQLQISPCISESGIQQSLMKLLRQKYVDIDVDVDLMQNTISLSPKGEALGAAIENKFREVDQELFGHLDDQRHQQVILKAEMIGKKMASIDEAPFDFWKLIISHNYNNCSFLNAVLASNLDGIEGHKK